MARNRKQKPVDEPPKSDIPIGTVTKVIERSTLPDGTINDLVEVALDAPTLSMHPAQRFHQEVQARIGKVNPNRVCPKCGQPKFLAERGKVLTDEECSEIKCQPGSTRRERICKLCGHVAVMIAAPELPLDSGE